MSQVFGHGMLAHWALDPDVVYLNHGTVGVTPRRSSAAQQRIRDEMERQPSRFLLRDLSGLVGCPSPEPTRIRQAADAVARFVGASASDLAFVDNATTGANAILRSFALAPGDEILVTDHNYGAITRTATYVARDRHATVKTVAVPYPAYDRAKLVAAVAAAIGPTTRIAVVDHISAESALIFPAAEIAAVCRSRGVAVVIDGAHVPGVLPLDVPAIGADYYVANLHKWAHAPRSTGFLWAHPSRQADLHPVVISWGFDLGFTNEFDWVGTRDPSAWLAAPEGIAFLHDLGFDAVQGYCHDLVVRAAHLLVGRWGTTWSIKDDDVGFMATVPLPERLGDTPEAAAMLRDRLLFDHGIEVQVQASHGRLWTRICAQVYNELSDYERLAEAVTRAVT